MESRLRKFISHRRGETATSQKSNKDRPAGPSRSGSLQDLSPISILQSLTKSNVEKSKGSQATDLASHAVPYERTTAGDAPTFGSEPVRGNGPVKLQASRRLSSGELLATPQDDQPTLEGILEGDYIMGGKSRRESSARSWKSPAIQSTTASIGRRSSLPHFQRSPSLVSKSSLTFSPNVRTDLSIHDVGTTSNMTGLGISTTVPHWTTASHDQRDCSPSRTASLSKYSCDVDVQHPSLAPIDEQNATIAALWKAEYSRLVQLYGQDGVQRNIARMNAGQGRLSVSSSIPRTDQSRFSIVLDPLPRPMREKESCDLRRSSDASGLSGAYKDDDSDASSNNRASLISSCAGSSAHTTNTAMTEHDTVMTREDIHKIVDEMRATYLRAFEARTSTTPTTSQHRKKKKRMKANSPVIVDSWAKPGNTGQGRQTWHAQVNETSDMTSTGQRKSRTSSQAAMGFGRLSPVEDSPTRGDARPTQRLQRADSATLGLIMANMGADQDSGVDLVHDLGPVAASLQGMNSRKSSPSRNSLNANPKLQEHRSSFQHSITRPSGNFF